MTDESGQVDEHEHHPQVAIRQAVRSDLQAIETILRETIQTPYGSGNVDENEVQEELRRIDEAIDSPDKGGILITEDVDGQSLGFAFFGTPDPRILALTHSDPSTTLELKLLYLHPSKRNQGIGSKLLDAVEEKAKTDGMSRIELTSGPRYFLIGSGEFYLKRGYRRVGTIPNYFEGKYPARVFQKDLK